MKRMMRTVVHDSIHLKDQSRFEPNIENFKRQRALPPYTSLYASSRNFFERVLHVKKVRDLVFITKVHAKNR